MKSLMAFFFAFVMLASAATAQTNWVIDKSHSKIGFAVDHLVISEVEGYFRTFDGKVTSKGDDFQDATIEFSVDINSINTDNKDRDNHLKSDDFFNAEKYPKMTFKSTSFKKVKDKKYKLTGDLTIRNTTKRVDLDVTFNGIVKDPWGNTKAGFKVTGELNRFDYGLKFNALTELGGAVVGENVRLNINIEVDKK